MKISFLSNSIKDLKRVYGEADRDFLAGENESPVAFSDSAYVKEHPEEFRDTEYIFSTWGMPYFSEKEIAQYFPSLKCIFYAAGSVQGFARPFLNSKVRIFSAWGANAIPVAEYTAALVELSAKGFFKASSLIDSKEGYAKAVDISNKYPGNYELQVGIIGAGMVGKNVIKRLSAYNCRIYVFDPFLPDNIAKELGVVKTDLRFIFENCTVISNHLADNPQTRGMITEEYFDLMRPYSTFINTGRGRQVQEPGLISFLRRREDVTAILDVTFPEPPEEGDALYELPNVILTPHIAGSKGLEVMRMGSYMVEEYKRVRNNEKCLWEVDLKMLETMA